MMMMLVSLFPAMATSFSGKKAVTPTEQSATPMATLADMPKLQTLSTDAFTPTTAAKRSGIIKGQAAVQTVLAFSKTVERFLEENASQLDGLKKQRLETLVAIASDLTDLYRTSIDEKSLAGALDKSARPIMEKNGKAKLIMKRFDELLNTIAEKTSLTKEELETQYKPYMESL